MFGEFDQLKALATSLVNEGDPNLGIVASDLLDALAQQPASMEADSSAIVLPLSVWKRTVT